MLDRKGKKIHVGDVVNVPCVVRGITQVPYGYNVLLEPLEALSDTQNSSRPEMLVNARQVELVNSIGESALDIDVGQALSDRAMLKANDARITSASK
jgi:hypothetical protein